MRACRPLCWAAGLALLVAAPLAAQDSAAVAPTDSVPSLTQVTTARKPSATGAMLKSLVLPGWGQLSLGRELTALVFVAGEAGTVTMVVRSQRDLNRARDLGDQDLIDQYTRKREDWMVYMGINHVLSALEAYVSAKLWDFPPDLSINVGPGQIGAGASLRFRIR
jgi:hypothetical protein